MWEVPDNSMEGKEGKEKKKKKKKKRRIRNTQNISLPPQKKNYK